MAGLPADIEGYREYVTSRLEPLRRTAYLLCGDWRTADDLVSATLVKLLGHWRRVSAMDSPDAYVRRTLLRVWLDERRRPWRLEAAWAEVPDRPVPPDRSSVLAITNNVRSEPRGGRDTTTAAAPLLTLDQLDELARTPGLTLYP